MCLATVNQRIQEDTTEIDGKGNLELSYLSF